MPDQKDPIAVVHTWNHLRKGRIVGAVVEKNDMWTTIRCTVPNPYAEPGEELTVRTSFLTKVEKP